MGKQIKAFIAVPSYWSIDPHFHVAMTQLYGWLAKNSAIDDLLPENHAEKGKAIRGKVAHSFGDSPNVGRSRNRLTAEFLAGDYTDLLFIDSDLVFSVDQVERILRHDEEVVGGMYFKKTEGEPEAVINGIRNPIFKESGLTQVGYIGTGFLRIKRSVFEDMIAKWGDEIWYNVDHPAQGKEYNFWHLGIYNYPDGSRRWLSEDWWFCQRCMDLGIRVWADRAITLRHSGHALFPLSYQAEKIFSTGETVAVAADVRGIPTLEAAA